MVWAAALPLVVTTAVLGIKSAPAAVDTTWTHGYDVSWPQCSGTSARNMPSNDPAYAILGLTDGAGHTVNPCLGSQLAWAQEHGVQVGAYLVPSYPTSAQRAVAEVGIFGVCGQSVICRLRNDGAAQAADAVATMHNTGMRAPMVWLDVEFRHFRPWSSSNARNRAVLSGAVAQLRRLHVKFGVYTTSLMWHDIAGNYRLDVPQWLPSGNGSAKRTKPMCEQTATGGPTWIVQYTRGLDQDLTCPALDPVPGTHSALWKFRRLTVRLLSQGAAVRAVQRVVGASQNGIYGVTTLTAVSVWQRAKGLPVTGRIGPEDWRAMGAYRVRGGHAFWLSRVVARA
jgi:hypothetical protein